MQPISRLGARAVIIFDKIPALSYDPIRMTYEWPAYPIEHSRSRFSLISANLNPEL